MKTISAEVLKQKIDSKEDDTVLINVLSRDDFEKKHIPDSINIPQKQNDFVQQVQKKIPDQSRTIIVYCASKDCPASSEAAKKLEEAGYTNVIDYEKGMEDWEKKSYPMTAKAT